MESGLGLGFRLGPSLGGGACLAGGEQLGELAHAHLQVQHLRQQVRGRGRGRGRSRVRVKVRVRARDRCSTCGSSTPDSQA